LLEPRQPDPSKNEIREVKDIITSTGGSRLIMPSEETPIKMGDEPKPDVFSDPVFRSSESSPREPKNLHEKTAQTFTRIFVNSIAQAEAEKENPQFAPGSVIVREKLLFGNDTEPQLVAVMIKREKGFSPKTGDWEFFILDGKDLKMQKRETKGDCAKCHIQVQNTDWVFRSYLK